ncbi:MAG TPA: sugar nucleotide-binding protein [Anaerolineae bacterium]
MSRLLITGGSSYLGRHLVPLAAEASEILYTFRQNDPFKWPQGRALDVLDADSVRRLTGDFRPDVILHTVGSNRIEQMDAVIRRGTTHVTQAAAAIGARLIHLSTDSIFDGLDAPYDESAAPTPVNAYGRAKAAAEETVQTYDNHVIVRTSLIYGLRLMDHGTAWMARTLRAGQPVTLFSNQRRNPVWTETLSRACLELAGHNYVGVLNVAGRQALTRAEFSLRMLDYWGVTERESLAIAPSDGTWPLDCELDLALATTLLKTPLLGVDEVLAQQAAIGD